MKKLILGIGLSAACLFAQSAAPAGNAANGRKLFENYGCYQCHGREAQGGQIGRAHV